MAIDASARSVPGGVPDPVVETGREIFRRIGRETAAAGRLERLRASALEQGLRDPDRKVRLLRFLDVFPAIDTSSSLAGHLREYFLSGDPSLPRAAEWLIRRSGSRLAAGAAAPLIRRAVREVARGFIAGETLGEALPRLKAIEESGRGFTLDLLGEAVLSEPEADRYVEECVGIVRALAAETAAWPPPAREREAVFPRVHLSVKPSALYSRIGPANHDDSVAKVKERLRTIFRAARESGGFVNLDMETRSIREIALDAFLSLLGEREFDGWENAGIVVQAYLRESRRDLRRLAGWARDARRRITVRLVKGAYWEHENIVARQNGWPVPVFMSKSHTDWNFERCVEILFGHADVVVPAVATHNVRSIAKAMATAGALGVPKDRFEFQMLYGMAEPVKRAVAGMGYAVREYVPVGELIPGMAYLVRRLLENGSNEGFLRKAFSEGASPEALLAEPEPYREERPDREPAGPRPFANEPPADFARRNVREAYRREIALRRAGAGKHYPVVIGGREYATAERIVSVNPARPEEVAGTASGVTPELVEGALAIARKAQPGWAARKPADRAEILLRAASIARRRREELAAWQVLEVGKHPVEADADVTEAIDYLEYYARQMLRLGTPVRLGEVPGEDNLYFYRPRGVGAVIAPWNFPLAIPVGMASAALVTGNAVLFKPSSLALVNGWLAYSLLQEAGVPEDVLHFLPGRGAVAGDFLAAHRDVDFIVFTGSREVGLGIVEKAGRTQAGQRSVKKAITEMGGKNAIIVDDDADLDQAVPGVVRSAFGFQGQKCSACSRVIVLRGCHDRFLSRLVEAVSGLPVGPPDDPANLVGPVIDGGARDRILRDIALGARTGTVLTRTAVPEEGFYVPPTVIADLPPDSPLLSREIFGPVLCVVRAATMEEAIREANRSEYALTGGLYSRSPAHIALAQATFDVGNLYVNRGITGAIVGRQPFGGFRMSGVGSKAGGPDYLPQFLEPRVTTENTVRRGFSPDTLS